MKSLSEEILKSLAGGEPLSEGEVDELASALRSLAAEGIAVPKHLMRHGYAGKPGTRRYYGDTVDAIPKALERMGADRETVVVGLIRRFEQAVRDHHEQVKNRKAGVPLDPKITARYFDVAFLLQAAKPETEKEAIQVAAFLRSEFDDVRAHAAEMLDGSPYFPAVVDRLFENITTYGIHQWPNRQAHALASFADKPEVRHRLLNCFHSQDEKLRYVAVLAFSYLNDKAGAEAESELWAIALNEIDRLQSEALSGLRKIDPRNNKLRQLALRLMKSDKFWVRGHAIACLEAFQDRESIDALLASLLDQGGHDFDNAGAAAKLLGKMPLDADQVLAPLIATLKTLLEREDKLYEEQTGYRDGIQALATAFKVAAEVRGDSSEDLGIVSYASPETLLAVARVVAKLGSAARPALPLIQSCLTRPYVSGSSDEGEWDTILDAIESA
jgi:hypothetical protein